MGEWKNSKTKNRAEKRSTKTRRPVFLCTAPVQLVLLFVFVVVVVVFKLALLVNVKLSGKLRLSGYALKEIEKNGLLLIFFKCYSARKI